jgi:hypothetical protein
MTTRYEHFGCGLGSGWESGTRLSTLQGVGQRPRRFPLRILGETS